MTRLGRRLGALVLACAPIAACSGPKTPHDQPTLVEVPTASASYAASPPHVDAGSSDCASDADCVPAECCHARTCVVAAKRPACAGARCTMECRGGTFDCGGGGCVCQEGRCVAELRIPPFRLPIQLD